MTTMKVPARCAWPLRCAAAALIVLGAAAAWIAPAAAHSTGAEGLANYRSTITGLRKATGQEGKLDKVPSVPGLQWKIEGGDAVLEVRNDTGEELLVQGYEGEPFLKVRPDGVFANVNSPALYLNEDRWAETAVPKKAGTRALPRWVPMGREPIHFWHDHRIHWMSPLLPPQVQADPSRPQRLFAWGVPFTLGDRELILAGELHWVPSPQAWPWLAAAAALSAMVVTVSGWRAAPLHRRRVVLRAGAVVAGAATLIGAARVAGELAAAPDGWLGLLVRAVAFLALAASATRRAWKADTAAGAALMIAAAALTGLGLLHLDALVSPQPSTALPLWLTRPVTALELVALLPAALAAAAANHLAGAAPDGVPATRQRAGTGRP